MDGWDYTGTDLKQIRVRLVVPTNPSRQRQHRELRFWLPRTAAARVTWLDPRLEAGQDVGSRR